MPGCIRWPSAIVNEEARKEARLQQHQAFIKSILHAASSSKVKGHNSFIFKLFLIPPPPPPPPPLWPYLSSSLCFTSLGSHHNANNYSIHLVVLLFSLSLVCSIAKLHGFFVTPVFTFLAGKPMVVKLQPLGRPLFLIGGGTFSPVRLQSTPLTGDFSKRGENHLEGFSKGGGGGKSPVSLPPA